MKASALIEMPSLATSTAAVLVRASTPPLLAPYSPFRGAAVNSLVTELHVHDGASAGPSGAWPGSRASCTLVRPPDSCAIKAGSHPRRCPPGSRCSRSRVVDSRVEPTVGPHTASIIGAATWASSRRRRGRRRHSPPARRSGRPSPDRSRRRCRSPLPARRHGPPVLGDEPAAALARTRHHHDRAAAVIHVRSTRRCARPGTLTAPCHGRSVAGPLGSAWKNRGDAERAVTKAGCAAARRPEGRRHGPRRPARGGRAQEDLASEPAGVRYEDVPELDGFWAVPEALEPDGAVLYLFGGGYVISSPHSRRKPAGHIAVASGTRVLVPAPPRARASVPGGGRGR